MEYYPGFYSEQIDQNKLEIKAIEKEEEKIEELMSPRYCSIRDEVTELYSFRLAKLLTQLKHEKLALITENKTLEELSNQVTIDEVLEQCNCDEVHDSEQDEDIGL